MVGAADFDDDEYKLIANEDGSWLVDGQYSLHDFLTYFDMDELINALVSEHQADLLASLGEDD